MAFAHPYFLLLLLLLPLAAWLKGRRGQPPAFLYSAVRLVEGLTRARRSRAGAFLAALRWLVLALFIVALAQPRLMKSATTVKASGVDIVVALDMSGSMISEDFVVGGQRVNRFNMARLVLKRFIDQRPNDRIGLVVFAAQAFIAMPLTLDHDFLQENLDRLEIGTINADRTAIGDALSTALNRLRELKSKSKIVILMTDGQNNAGKVDPLTVAEAAQALGAKVYTIGIGTRGMAPMPVIMDGQKSVIGKCRWTLTRTRFKKSPIKPAANIIAPTTRNGSSKFTRRLTSWKKPRRSSINSPNSTNCFLGLCRSGWRCCWSKWRWDKPCFGGCHEDIAD